MTREEAIQILSESDVLALCNGDTPATQAVDMAIEALKELSKRREEAKRWKTKALQAEPVKHGEWKYYNYSDVSNPYQGYFICSVCEEYEHTKHKYCPNCGAKMDGRITKKCGNTQKK